MRKLISLFFLLFVFGIWVQAQSTMVGGVILDESGEPIIGATVLSKESHKGTITDFDGKYQLSIEPTGTLVVSYMGFITKEVAVKNQTTINITLQEDSKSLDEVVVIGYGSMKTKDLTSSITTVKSDEILKNPNANVMQSLQGKVAGMQIISSGAPGASPTVRIRGIGSYPGSGNTNPLYVVDGVFYDTIDFLNPNDIASTSVLKDASASAIYGVRAANGVVLIETKSGHKNEKAKIEYNGYYGVQVAQNVLKMANSQQYTNYMLQSGSAANIQSVEDAMLRFGRSRVDASIPAPNTNWYDEILRTAETQNHAISISGGTDKAAYALGGSYFSQDGILDMENDFERINLRAKLDFDANEWLKVGGNVIISNIKAHGANNSAFQVAYFAPPIMPVMDPTNTEATPTAYSSAETIGFRDGKNPMVYMDNTNNLSETKKNLVTFYAKFNLIPEKLTFKTTFSDNFTSVNSRNVNKAYYLSPNAQRKDDSVTKNFSKYENKTWDNVLTYKDQFGDHSLTAMLGTSFQDNSYSGLWAEGLNFPIDSQQTWYISQAEDVPSQSVGDDGLHQYAMSYFGRVNYSYKNRYMLYGTVRRDGTSKYQEKWGIFPTIGLGWVISEENFFDVPQIDFLKIRASYGKLGNNSVAASSGSNTTTVETVALNDQLYSGTTTSSTYSELEWEEIYETNIGITAQAFDSRLSADMDYYKRKTDNAVIYVNNPLIGGSVRKNAGTIENSGFEVALSWQDKIGDFNYGVSGNIATLKNEVTSLYGQQYLDGGSAEFRQRTILGESLLAFYGWKTDGVYQNAQEIADDPIAVANQLEPGDYRFKDVNNDGVLDSEDRVVLGSFMPDFTYGLNFNVAYKQWELSVSTYGQSGNKILNRKRGEIIWTNDGNIDADLASNLWHGEGTSNKYVSAAGLSKSWNQKMSDYFVESGDFFRIQNIQLAYNVHAANWPVMRISLTAEKPFTFTNYNGFNPEVADGIDNQTYPIASTYTLGLNIKF